VGVLRGLLDLGVISAERSDFEVVVGASAGAVNGAALAGRADQFGEGVSGLERVWGNMAADQVFRTDLRSLGGIGMRWVRDLSFGGVLRRVAPKSLLDTEPLRQTLANEISFDRIDANIESGALTALALPATNLYTADGVVFIHGQLDLPLWKRGRWSVERARIGVEHVMASSAIPVFFPSVEMEGRHFGDGCIRNTAPLSPAIHLGADRIVAIGVREPGRPPEAPGGLRRNPPTIAQIAGVLLDAVMLDAFETDIEHSERVNKSVLACPTGDPANPFRWIEVLWLSPSREFATIASDHADRIPAIVRYLMRGLGPDESTTELASYLLFDAEFCGRLMELGRADVQARAASIEEFFSPSDA
jgi:NTE family protein